MAPTTRSKSGGSEYGPPPRAPAVKRPCARPATERERCSNGSGCFLNPSHGFFTLPPELRLKVYKNLCGKNDVEAGSDSRCDDNGINGCMVAKLILKQSSRRLRRIRTSRALLSTCKLNYAEYLPVFCSGSSIQADDLAQLAKILDRIGSNGALHLENIYVKFFQVEQLSFQVIEANNVQLQRLKRDLVRQEPHRLPKVGTSRIEYCFRVAIENSTDTTSFEQVLHDLISARPTTSLMSQIHARSRIVQMRSGRCTSNASTPHLFQHGLLSPV